MADELEQAIQNQFLTQVQRLSGANGMFEVFGPKYDKGYRIIFRLPYTATTQPSEAPAFSDPRGVFPSDMMPSSTLSYEVYEEVREFASYNTINVGMFPGLVGAVLMPIALAGFGAAGGQVTVSAKTMVSVIAFEGRDIIDLPTEGLPRDGDAIIVPHNVYLPVYAGDLFMKPGDKETFASKAAKEYISKSPSNQIKQVAPSVNPPLDSMTNEGGFWPHFQTPNRIVDVASNKIRLNGSAQYISYVSFDKAIFRDVVFLRTGAIGQGTNQKNSLLFSFVGPYGTTIGKDGKTVGDVGTVQILRYAFVDAKDGTGEPPYFQWKLSESFGYKPDTVEKTPASALKTDQDRQADFLYESGLHFAYNVKDTAGPDLDNNTLPMRILKTGITPTFAASKMDKRSVFYDSNFKASIVPLAKNQFFNKSRLQIKTIVGFSPGVNSYIVVGNEMRPNNFGTVYGSNVIATERTYQSPFFNVDMTRNGRIGIEYAVHNFAHTSVFGMDRAMLLASTTPAMEGLVAFYDPCICATVVVFADNGIISQRLFDDKQLLAKEITIAPSKLKAFLLAEILQRSGGQAAFHPPYKDIGATVAAGTEGRVAIPTGFLPTLLTVNAPEHADTKSILRLYAEAQPQDATTPLFEVVLPNALKGTSPERKIPIPPISFFSYKIENPNGGSLTKALGSGTKGFLQAISQVTEISPPAPTDAFSDFQLKSSPEEDFPLRGQSVTGCAVHTKGHSFLAYENGGQVNLGFRPSISNTYLPIRDVCLRVPEGFTTAMLSEKASGLPSATQPLLLADLLPNRIFLFYEYKNRILIKQIPMEIVDKEKYPFDNTVFPAETETKIAKNIHRMIPSIVYDGGQGKTADIAPDISINALKAPGAAVAGAKSPSVKYYSACLTNGGLLVSFLQDGDKIIARKSSDAGSTWEDVFPSGTTILPVKAGTANVQDGEAPSLFFEQEQNCIFLFIVLQSSLLLLRIPEQLFLEPQDKAKEYLSKIVPELVYGALEDGKLPVALQDRGIMVQPAVIERQKAQPQSAQGSTTTKEHFSTQKVSVVRYKGGPLRLYFVDDNKRLQTLISIDGGKGWQTESQFISNRDRKS